MIEFNIEDFEIRIWHHELEKALLEEKKYQQEIDTEEIKSKIATKYELIAQLEHLKTIADLEKLAAEIEKQDEIIDSLRKSSNKKNYEKLMWHRDKLRKIETKLCELKQKNRVH